MGLWTSETAVPATAPVIVFSLLEADGFLYFFFFLHWKSSPGTAVTVSRPLFPEGRASHWGDFLQSAGRLCAGQALANTLNRSRG